MRDLLAYVIRKCWLSEHTVIAATQNLLGSLLCYFKSLHTVSHKVHIKSLWQWSSRCLFFSNLSFLVWPLLRTHCRCKRSLLHLIRLNSTKTICRTHLDEGQYTLSQEIDIHSTGWIRTRSLSKRVSADSRLRPRGHRNQSDWYIYCCNL
jgi:hypothetical protein